MNMQKTSKISFIAGSLLTAVLITSAPAFAEGSRDNVSTSGSSQTTSSRSSSEVKTNVTNTETQKVDDHLQADKLKQCQKSETKVDSSIARIRARGQKQLDLFTTIATRVETFYTKSGKTLSNYDALVTAVNTQKAVSQQAVNTLKAQNLTFKCGDGTDHKLAKQTFKVALKTEIQALKDYRTAVKNLIVGVKSVVSVEASTKNGGSN